jgi:hypothetical protein
LNTKLLLRFSLLFAILNVINLNAQCNNNSNTACGNVNGTNRGTISPNKWDWLSVPIYAGEVGYYEFHAEEGESFEFRSCSTDNIEITIATSGNQNRKEYDRNTYYCSNNNNNEYAVYTATSTGTHRVKYSRHGGDSCSNTSTSGTLEYKKQLLKTDYFNGSWVFGYGRDSFWIGNVIDFSGNVNQNYLTYFGNNATKDGYVIEPLNFDRNFGDATPGSCGNLFNTFAIYYGIHKYFTPGRYRITVGGDDGFVLRYGYNTNDFQSTDLINNWNTGSYRTETVEVNLSGFIALRLYYFENSGNGRISFNIERITDTNLISGEHVICGISTSTQLSTNQTVNWSTSTGLNTTADGLITSTANTALSITQLPKVSTAINGVTTSGKRFIVAERGNFSYQSNYSTTCLDNGGVTILPWYTTNFKDPLNWFKHNFNQPSKLKGTDFSLQQNAVISNGTLKLGGSQNAQTGSIVIENPDLNTNVASCSFDLKMSNGNANNGVKLFYGPVGVYFDATNDNNPNSTKSNNIGNSCEPRRFNSQGVSVKVVYRTENSEEIIQCHGFSHDIINKWSNIMVVMVNGKLSVIIDGNYILESVIISELNTVISKNTWNWELFGSSNNGAQEIDELSIYSFNDMSAFEYSSNSTNGVNGDWQKSTVLKNLPSGYSTVYVRSRFPDFHCFNPTGIPVSTANFFNLTARQSGFWSDISLWYSDFPQSYQCVIIPSGLTVTIPSGYTAVANTVTVEQGGKLILEEDATLMLQHTILNKNANPNAILFGNNANLIQNNNELLKPNEGNVTFIRESNPMDKYGYTYWSSPVFGQNAVTTSPLYAGANNGLRWDYQNSNLTWVNNNGQMIAGKGYIIRAPQNLYPWNTQLNGIWQKESITGNFKGIPNNGIIPTYIFPSPNNEMTLIGNPYPSTIDADKLLLEYGQGLASAGNEKIIPTLYFWTHSSTPIPSSSGMYSYHSSDYSTYTLLGGVGTFPSMNDDTATIPTGLIAAGQGFFVQGTQSGGTIEFKNAYRYNTGFTKLNDGQFFRTYNRSNVSFDNQEANEIELEKHRIWLHLKDNNDVYKQILLGFSNYGTDDLDALDGKTINETAANMLYTKINNQPYSIQSFGLPFSVEKIIPIGYKLENAGNYSISLSDFDGLFENENIYIRDNFTNQIVDLKQSDYHFNSFSGTFETRFDILFYLPLSTDDFAVNKNWIVYNSNSNLIIETNNFEMKKIAVYDVLGKLIYQSHANGNHHKITGLSTNQVYLIKITTNDEAELTKKVVL